MVIRSHPLLYLRSRTRHYFLPDAYRTVFIRSVKQLLDCAGYFRTFPELAALVEVLHIELVPDIMNGMWFLSDALDEIDPTSVGDSGANSKMPTGKELAFIDRRRIIVPSPKHASWLPTPCYNPDDVHAPDFGPCGLCDRIGECCMR